MTLVDRSVLITGGSGSFGHAFTRHALDAGARRVAIFSRGEAKQAQMSAEFGDDRLRFMIGDVRDVSRVLDACRGVDVVVHAAALKRVETCEADPSEAVQTNVIGTLNVARACIERGVQKAVILSTDKASAPNTLYGATKLAAERAWLASNVYSAGTPTRFSATRYGNVLGSTGSVVATWRAQAQAGRITITDPTMSRFWMRMEEAVELVDLALREMRGGEVFIPKLMSCTIADLARAVAPKASWAMTGIRPGEKLHETLISPEEARHTFDCGGYYVIEPEARTWGEVTPLSCTLVPAGFEYRSDSNAGLTVEEVREMAA